jgi:hypothetical protein
VLPYANRLPAGGIFGGLGLDSLALAFVARLNCTSFMRINLTHSVVDMTARDRSCLT